MRYWTPQVANEASESEDMGLSTFPWAEYFRRYEDYASKWGFAPVTGSVSWPAFMVKRQNCLEEQPLRKPSMAKGSQTSFGMEKHDQIYGGPWAITACEGAESLAFLSTQS